ncbi:MAG: NPCBM/NEW2 domain-containing protein [Planctomycetes bacterium]|nr:NPCBM/NEW2 domain-containing protein [Planctomycetota bacterium]
MRCRLCAVWVGFAACCLTWTTLAQEPAKTEVEVLLKPWVEAKARFQKARETAEAIIVRQLESAEEKARASGDLDKVNSIKQEHTLFVKDGVAPTSVRTTAYEKSMESAKGSLRTAAQKTKTVLVKQRFDDDAAAIDQELKDLLESVGSSAKSVSAPVPKPSDGRFYWAETPHANTANQGNQFRLIRAGEWVETTGDGGRKRYHWVEVSRTAEFVELQDKDRSFGMRLKSSGGDVAYKYEVGRNNSFGGWAKGGWVIDSPDVVYLADLPEKSVKVWHYLDNKDFGWGKGRMLDEGKWYDIYLDNRPSPNGLLTVPPANDIALVRYDVSRLRREVLRAKFGVADLRKANPASPLTFIVLGDGQKLFTSKPVAKWGEATDCEVKIRGVKELELRVECSGAADLAYAVWYEPRLSLK